jgi:nucleoside-diphosphate-sugar epimerase
MLERLLAQEDRVRVLTLPETVKDIRHPNQVEVVIGSLADEASLVEAVQGVETVYHLAALLPGSSYDDLMRVNVHGTENLLRACGQVGGVRRFVFTSSVSVYEGAFIPEDWPLTEVSALRPRGPERLRFYGLSKVTAESLVRRYANEFGFDWVILRPSAAYGIGNKRIEALIQWALTDPRADYNPFAGPNMQPIHVRDLADGITQAGNCPEAANEIFNLAGSEVLTYSNLVTMVRRLGGIADGMTLRPDRSRIWRRYDFIYDLTKTERSLGFMPRVMIHEGLAEMVAAFMAAPGRWNGRYGSSFR